MPIRILIADDNALVRTAMRQVLEGADEHWEIVEAENGEEAVAKAQELRPSLIIVDLVMPLMDGMAASRQIAKLLPETPILMHTLYTSPAVELEAGKVGVRKIVAKSESKALVSAVQELLDSRPASGIPPLASAEDNAPSGRRTEDRIRELCAQLLATKDSPANEPLFAELRAAVHRHIQNLRMRIAEYPAMTERRVRKKVPRPGKQANSNVTTPSPASSVPSIAIASSTQPEPRPPTKPVED